MEVILMEKIERLGTLGQTVKVKNGFARNFLLPTGKALRANKDNMAFFEKERAAIEATNAKRRDAAAADSKKLDKVQVVLIRQASEAGQLYGSVNARDIADALSAATKTHVLRSAIVLNQPIKNLGIFDIAVVLHAEVKAQISVNIARTEDEAVIQKKTGKALVKSDAEDKAADDAAAAAKKSKAAATSEQTEEEAA